jgi:hypothetical protein
MFQPTACVVHFETFVVVGRLWAQTDLFDLDLGLRLPRFALFLFLLVQEFSKIHHPDYGGIGIGGDFNQVQFSGFRSGQTFSEADNAQVFTILVNQPDLRGTDLFIDSIFVFVTYSFLSPSDTILIN